MLFLDEHVHMVDSTDDADVRSRVVFTGRPDILQVDGHVVVTDRSATLEAPSGTYDRRTGRAELNGGVHGRDEHQRLTCDHVTYVRDSMLVKARGNVSGLDVENRLEIRGQSVDYDRQSHEAVASGNPMLISRDNKDRPTEIRAQLLRLNTDTRLAEAIDSVRA
jgi:lipopolysaccharide export system protein LptA